MTFERKEDCPLYCGREAVKDVRTFWHYEAKDTLKDILVKIWLIFSLPVFFGIIYSFFQGWMPNDIFLGLVARILIVVAFVGIIADLVVIKVETEMRLLKYDLVISKRTAQAIDNHIKTASHYVSKAGVKAWEMGSPVLLVWLVSSYHFGDFGTLPSNESFITIFWLAIAICLPGCWHDVKFVFGDIAHAAWNNREKNPVGMIERTILRGIGYVSITLRQCDMKKAHEN